MRVPRRRAGRARLRLLEEVLASEGLASSVYFASSQALMKVGRWANVTAFLESGLGVEDLASFVGFRGE